MLIPHHLLQNQLTRNTLALVLAGGKGTRLHELTKSTAKPALMFAGKCRVIDFPLCNCMNSGIKKIGVMTQYKPESLASHIDKYYDNLRRDAGEFVDVLQSEQRSLSGTCEGTAHAVYQNIAFIRKHHPKFVAVLAGDHVYKMDYTDMLASHVNSHADMTISCIEVPVEEAAGAFGVMRVNDKNQIVDFHEKPLHPAELIDKPGYTLASMGNYIFNTEFLIEQLLADANRSSSEHDFGKDIIPSLIKNNKVSAYRFKDIDNNRRPYWRDIGTLDSFWQANMDLLGDKPKLKLDDDKWPISTEQVGPKLAFPMNMSNQPYVEDQCVNKELTLHASFKSLIGRKISDTARINKSALSSSVHINDDSIISESVILPNVKIGRNVIIRKAIIDEGCVIPDNTRIGINHADDIARGFRLSDKGVVLVSKDMPITLTQDETQIINFAQRYQLSHFLH